MEYGNGRFGETRKLYDRAIEIEPLWWPVVVNRLSLLLAVSDAAEHLRSVRDPALARKCQRDVTVSGKRAGVNVLSSSRRERSTASSNSILRSRGAGDG